MDIQSIIVIAIVLTAVFFLGKGLFKKRRSFRPKQSGCGDDCGCTPASKKRKLPI